MSNALEAASLRADVEALYAEYCEVLDEGPLDAWPELFTEECTYKVIARENFTSGRPLATLALESRGMLKDRLFAVRETLFHQPYSQRHLVSGLRIEATAEGTLQVRANYLVIRTKDDELAEVLSVGRYRDTLVHTGNGLRFREKLCVFDNELIPNALIYPI